MTIPKKLKVGGLHYTVTIETEKELRDCVGEMDNEELTIKLRKAKKEAMELTFLHEILHAINNEMTEMNVEFMAQALYQILKDNPKLFTEGGEQHGK